MSCGRSIAHNEIDYRASFTPGDFSFAYRVCDASGLCTVATVRVSVAP